MAPLAANCLCTPTAFAEEVPTKIPSFANPIPLEDPEQDDKEEVQHVLAQASSLLQTLKRITNRGKELEKACQALATMKPPNLGETVDEAEANTVQIMALLRRANDIMRTTYALRAIGCPQCCYRRGGAQPLPHVPAVIIADTGRGCGHEDVMSWA
eukprot:CAMPEP_0117528130 /NCGR_PEP_ID=MMETSP0784-20121206/37155_1 /TAXON_ID=39447 /ORGANISM="" /LENGTH=155 /DNA_ID=CAMNT_0005324405 /DNA_START=68 /DNA_END=532 /DNA_ORIENTATION=-